MTDQDRLQQEIDRLRRQNEAQLKRQNTPQPLPKPSWAHKVDQPVQKLTEKQLKAMAVKTLYEADQKLRNHAASETRAQKDKGLFHEDNTRATSAQFNANTNTAEDILRRAFRRGNTNERSR